MRRVELAGLNGPLATQARAAGVRPIPLEWHLSEPELLRLLGSSSETHLVLIDLKPRAKDSVSLYRLRDVWGYSYAMWSLVALRLEDLMGDEHSGDPHADKIFYHGPRETGSFCYEFLYLNGGTEEGHWGWGLTGRVNAPLLSPEALASFLRRINAQRLELQLPAIS